MKRGHNLNHMQISVESALSHYRENADVSFDAAGQVENDETDQQN